MATPLPGIPALGCCDDPPNPCADRCLEFSAETLTMLRDYIENTNPIRCSSLDYVGDYWDGRIVFVPGPDFGDGILRCRATRNSEFLPSTLVATWAYRIPSIEFRWMGNINGRMEIQLIIRCSGRATNLWLGVKPATGPEDRFGEYDYAEANGEVNPPANITISPCSDLP